MIGKYQRKLTMQINQMDITDLYSIEVFSGKNHANMAYIRDFFHCTIPLTSGLKKKQMKILCQNEYDYV